jgi:hypothetical protein
MLSRQPAKSDPGFLHPGCEATMPAGNYAPWSADRALPPLDRVAFEK